MIARRLKELLALAMVGEGVVATLFPTEHASLWRVGPRGLRKLVAALAERPHLTQIIAMSEAAVGLWLAQRQFCSAKQEEIANRDETSKWERKPARRVRPEFLQATH